MTLSLTQWKYFGHSLKKSAQEAFAMGRQTIENPLNQIWAEAILEIQPVG